jgi:hypothetical protein
MDYCATPSHLHLHIKGPEFPVGHGSSSRTPSIPSVPTDLPPCERQKCNYFETAVGSIFLFCIRGVPFVSNPVPASNKKVGAATWLYGSTCREPGDRADLVVTSLWPIWPTHAGDSFPTHTADPQREWFPRLPWFPPLQGQDHSPTPLRFRRYRPPIVSIRSYQGNRHLAHSLPWRGLMVGATSRS